MHVASDVSCSKCMFQIFHVFYLDVSNVDFSVAYVALAIHACFKCFIYFKRTLQMFIWMFQKYICVAHIAMATHICFKRMFQVFHLFHTYVASVLFRCFKSRS
jgi:hypothetical protein